MRFFSQAARLYQEEGEIGKSSKTVLLARNNKGNGHGPTWILVVHSLSSGLHIITVPPLGYFHLVANLYKQKQGLSFSQHSNSTKDSVNNNQTGPGHAELSCQLHLPSHAAWQGTSAASGWYLRKSVCQHRLSAEWQYPQIQVS